MRVKRTLPPHQLPALRGVRSVARGLLALTLLTGSARAGDAEVADEHYRRGVEFARSGQLESARTEFEAALAVEPHPRVLYNLAKLALEMGDRTAAVAYMRRYLETYTTQSPPTQVEEVRTAFRQLTGEEPPARIVAPPADGVPPSAPGPEARSGEPPGVQGAPLETERPSQQPAPPSDPVPSVVAPSPEPVSSPPTDDAADPDTSLAGILLGGTGLAMFGAGLGVWIWNDARHGQLTAERERLVANMPTVPSAPEDLDPAFEYSFALGRNEAGFESVQQFDAVAWSLMGVGVACMAVGTWLFVRSNVPARDRVAFGADRLVLRW